MMSDRAAVPSDSRRVQAGDLLLQIVWHSRTGASEQLAHAAHEAALTVDSQVAIGFCDAVTPDAMLAARSYLFVCPENLATMSGAMKEFFDRCYYPLLDRITGRAYATAISAGSDGQGAQRQIDRIAQGWRLKRVAQPLIVNLAAQTPEQILAPKRVGADALSEAGQLGEALAAGAQLGIY